MKLWIDDVRPDPDREHAGLVQPEGWHWAKTVQEAISWLEINRCQPIDVISFDHDLGYAYMDSATVIDGGGNPADDKFSSSRPVLIWMIENDVWPDEIRVHSHNPIGAEWLAGTADRYAPAHVRIQRKRYEGSRRCTC